MSHKKHSTLMQIFYFGLIGLAVLLLAYGGISWLVYSELESICFNARQKYPGDNGDNVDALIKYLKTESLSSKEESRVIWALGELRSERALPTLKALLQNDRSHRYEVQKAIKKIKGQIPNPYFWRKKGDGG